MRGRVTLYSNVKEAEFETIRVPVDTLRYTQENRGTIHREKNGGWSGRRTCAILSRHLETTTT